MTKSSDAMSPEVVIVGIMAAVLKAADMIVTELHGEKTYITPEVAAERAWQLLDAVKRAW
jgi:hypothetical protein